MKKILRLSYISFFGVLAIGCLLGNPLMADDTSEKPDPQSNARPYTAVYPLDAVQSSDGTVWVVDRNLPGVWKYQNNQLSVFARGNKTYRKALNAVRCIALSPSNKLYVGDPATRDVYLMEDDGSSKPIASASIGIPVDLAFASDGTLYVADLEKRSIWRIKSDGSAPEIFIKGANARGLFVDSGNRLWCVSQNKEQLVRYDVDGKPTVLIADRTFEFPHQIVVDSTGTAWISDGYKKCVWKYIEGQEPTVAIESDLLQNPVGLFLVDDHPNIVDPHAMATFRLDESGSLAKWFDIKQ